jgi:hypothetical protein
MFALFHSTIGLIRLDTLFPTENLTPREKKTAYNA